MSSFARSSVTTLAMSMASLASLFAPFGITPRTPETTPSPSIAPPSAAPIYSKDILKFNACEPDALRYADINPVLRAQLGMFTKLQRLTAAFTELPEGDRIREMSRQWNAALQSQPFSSLVTRFKGSHDDAIWLNSGNPSQISYVFLSEQDLKLALGAASAAACYETNTHTIYLPLELADHYDLKDPRNRILVASYAVHELAHAEGCSEFGAYSAQMRYLSEHNLTIKFLTRLPQRSLVFANADQILEHIFFNYPKSDYIAAVLERFHGDITHTSLARKWLPGGAHYESLLKEYNETWTANQAASLVRLQGHSPKRANRLAEALLRSIARKHLTPYDSDQLAYTKRDGARSRALTLRRKLRTDTEFDPSIISGVRQFLDLLSTERESLGREFGAHTTSALEDSLVVRMEEILVEAERLHSRSQSQ